jgi:putative ABC transport system permease protein
MAWYHRLRNVFQRDRTQRDIDRELAFHIAERADELQARGMSEDEAIRSARRSFGNLTAQRERTSDMDVAGWLEAILRNFRHTARTLAKTPVFTATVVLTLALGIGANSAVFSAIYAVLLRPLPFPDGDQLMELRQSNRKSPETLVAPVRLQEWNRLNSTFQAITGYYSQDDSELSGELPEKLKRAFVAPRFLQVWGISPALGRDFTPQEERFGGPNAILISDRFWRRRFGSDPNAIGKRIRLGASAFPIAGVMPASFLFPDRDVDLWSPIPMDAPYAQSREATWFTTIGRLKPGVTVAQARANLATVQTNLAKQYPKTDSEITVSIQPLKEATVSGARRSLWIVFGSVSLLLLIACTNIAALLLTRAAQRQHEISVRFSLGASRASVAAQLLTEAFVLALGGAVLGLFLAAGASTVFRSLARNLPRIEEIRLDWRIVLYSLACAIAATLACGLFPAIRATQGDVSRAIAQGGRTQVFGRNPVHLMLVGVQVALAVTLLAGAGLLLRSFQALGRVEPGFDPSHVLTFQISSSWAEAGGKPARQRTDRILDSLRSLPGVEAAATSVTLPGAPAQYQIELKVAEGRASTEPKIIAESRYVTPGYFATLRIPLLAGEVCGEQPDLVSVVVNRSFANTYLMGSAAIGRHLQLPDRPNLPPGEIRGMVGDARESGIDHLPVPTVYWCSGAIQPGTFFLIRTRVAPRTMVEAFRRKIHEIEPRRSVFDITPLEERISDAFAETRLRTFLLAFFAATAMSLACVGLYGTLSYLVSVRRREVALRLALGALRGQIVTHFLVQGLGVSFLGCAAGLGLAALFARLLAGMLYGVSPSDATTLASVVLVVLVVAMIASLFPAIRAARLEPMQILRDE